MLDDGVSLEAGGVLDDGVSLDEGGALDDGGSLDEGGVLDEGCSLDAGGALDDGGSLDVGGSLDEGSALDEGCSLDEDGSGGELNNSLTPLLSSLEVSDSLETGSSPSIAAYAFAVTLATISFLRTFLGTDLMHRHG